MLHNQTEALHLSVNYIQINLVVLSLSLYIISLKRSLKYIWHIILPRHCTTMITNFVEISNARQK